LNNNYYQIIRQLLHYFGVYFLFTMQINFTYFENIHL